MLELNDEEFCAFWDSVAQGMKRSVEKRTESGVRVVIDPEADCPEGEFEWA